MKAGEGKTGLDEFVEALWDAKDPDKAKNVLETRDVDLTAVFNGKTALHFAALDGYEGLVRELVQRGADIDALDEQRGTTGFTPLIWAAMNGQAEVCKALVELGADASIKDKSGMTAIDMARAYDHEAAVKALEPGK